MHDCSAVDIDTLTRDVARSCASEKNRYVGNILDRLPTSHWDYVLNFCTCPVFVTHSLVSRHAGSSRMQKVFCRKQVASSLWMSHRSHNSEFDPMKPLFFLQNRGHPTWIYPKWRLSLPPPRIVGRWRVRSHLPTR